MDATGSSAHLASAEWDPSTPRRMSGWVGELPLSFCGLIWPKINARGNGSFARRKSQLSWFTLTLCEPMMLAMRPKARIWYRSCSKVAPWIPKYH